jgi:DeoR/GlpR family transcriptional regulator of sugar metabolism
MLTKQRKQFLLDRLARDGRIVAKELSEELDLSEDTIRRDLRELAAEGLLERVHGGALPASPTVATLDVRRTLATDEKRQLASCAARYIAAGQSVFIDGGTTHLELVREIPLRLKCRIITHSPIIAAALEQHVASVTVIGGQLFRHSMVHVGASTMESILRQRCELAFVGLTGFHADEGGSTGDAEEAHIKRAIIARAAETMVLLTSEKIGAVSAHAVCKASDLSRVVVAKNADTSRLATAGVQIVKTG